MAGFFTQLMNFAQGGGALGTFILALLMLLTGYLLVRTAKMLVRRKWISVQELNKKEVKQRHETLRYLGYVFNGVIVLLVLLYLNTDITQSFSEGFAEFLPNLLSAFLVAVLGFIGINLSLKLGSNFLKSSGARGYFQEIGLSSNAVRFGSTLVKGFLYLIVLQIALAELGIGDTFLAQLITASSWAAAFLVAGLLFYGFKDLFRNYAAGLYLKNSRLARPGEQVKLEEDKGEIREVSLFSTTIDTDTGYTLMTPNSRVMDAEMKFKRTKNDIETLADIKNHFVAQHPSYCGPAAMEMALDIFGYRYSQEEIGEEAGTTEKAGAGVDEEPGTGVEELKEAVEELTGGEVKTAFVEYDKIGDLGDEAKAWFNDGALIVPNFYKPELFPGQETYGGHYVLSVAAERDEILVVDPSDRSGTGGVYYVNANRLLDAMAEFDHSRGYIVVAPEGTTAYWRIKNDLIYSDRNYYDELSKTLETRLRKILRRGGILKNSMPSSIEDYMEDWRSGEPVTRLWKSGAEGEEDEAAEDN